MKITQEMYDKMYKYFENISEKELLEDLKECGLNIDEPVPQTIYLTDASEEAKKRLEECGFKVCCCCSSKNAKWLHFYYRTRCVAEPVKEVHGVGNGCDNECKDMSCEKCLKCHLDRCINDNDDVHIFKDVDRFIEYINEQYT